MQAHRPPFPIESPSCRQICRAAKEGSPGTRQAQAPKLQPGFSMGSRMQGVNGAALNPSLDSTLDPASRGPGCRQVCRAAAREGTSKSCQLDTGDRHVT